MAACRATLERMFFSNLMHLPFMTITTNRIIPPSLIGCHSTDHNLARSTLVITRMEGKAFQDMPPPGGFGSIKVERVPPRPLIKQAYLAAAVFAMSVYGWNFIREFRQRMFAYHIEENEHYVAVLPFMDAERERKFLIQLHKLREYEKELMKDVPGWKLGTLYGEKLYKTLPPDSIPPINLNEYGAHRPLHEVHVKIIHPGWHQ